ncbi:hypothetical protein [Streptomyces bluensis]|uniref:hypothetical protein n=1 Tax=Streptomyces bluensis TaxID=33897 RepID=UPI001672A507|nr:hypothetical protein [Streptomyces bluensis]GGZ90576.1 hypothetical protein GCM10010344_67740 [Streptomyces bluensis]
MVKAGSVAVVAAGLVLVLGGCGGGGGTDEDAEASGKGAAKATATPPPSEELVAWVGGMCEATAAIGSLRADSAADLKEIRNSGEADLTAQAKAAGYLAGTPQAVEDVESDLEDLDSSGVPAADRLRDAWLKKVRGVVTGLEGVTPGDAFKDTEGSTADVDRLVQSLTPPEPDLPALTKKDTRLAAAYKSAEQCAPGWQPGEETESPSPDPTGPLPKAADGKNTDACSDGACEVLVTSTADITANGVNVHVSVGKDYVTFQTAGTLMQLGGAGGEAGFGDDLKATVVAHNKDGAVLKFTTP